MFIKQNENVEEHNIRLLHNGVSLLLTSILLEELMITYVSFASAKGLMVLLSLRRF